MIVYVLFISGSIIPHEFFKLDDLKDYLTHCAKFDSGHVTDFLRVKKYFKDGMIYELFEEELPVLDPADFDKVND